MNYPEHKHLNSSRFSVCMKHQIIRTKPFHLSGFIIMDVCIGFISLLCFIYALMQKILIAYSVMPLRAIFHHFFSGVLAQHEVLVRSCTFFYAVWNSKSAVLKKRLFYFSGLLFHVQKIFQNNIHLQELPIESYPHNIKVKVTLSVLCRLTPPSVGLATHFNSPCTVFESSSVTAERQNAVSLLRWIINLLVTRSNYL